jgi:hypothetical protein
MDGGAGTGAAGPAARRRPLGRVLTALSVSLLAVTGACSGSTATPTNSSGSAGSVSPAAGPRPSSVRYLPAPERLSCNDGTSGITPPAPGTRWVNGLSGDGWAGSASAPGGTKGQEPTFWKSFLYVGPNAARWTVLSVVDPPSARIYYVPFRFWSPPGDGSPRPALGLTDPGSGRTTIAFEYCGQQPLGFTGGVTTLGPACVTLAVTAPGRRAASVRLPLGARC